MDELIKQIQSKGYWEVRIRPVLPNKKEFSLAECLDTVKQCKVSIRGWDYPHVDHENTLVKNNFAESHCSFMDLTEYWRYYQSGQFIHFFTIREDWTTEKERMTQMLRWHGRGERNVDVSGLSILSTLYYFTEILEFSSRLAKKGVLGKEVMVSIKLFKMKNRQLFYWSPERHLNRAYICQTDPVIKEVKFSADELISNTNKIALKWFIETMHLFQWMTPPEKLMSEEQKRFIEKRF